MAERWFVLGTAGHVDHGKTSLVKALTGVDTDRWQEEKDRGITIDLGFAELDLGEGVRAAIVDVPGHEGLVRNMLAGATGVDAALIVVAADEGPMPQTVEHVAILSLMQVQSVVVALSKTDLADPEWVDLVEEEVRDLLAEYGFTDSVLVRTSAQTGAGLDELRSALRRGAPDVSSGGAPDSAIFRMPVDRAFSVRGTGTVVTGSIASGRVAKGQDLRVLPGGTSVRVRRVHVFGEEVAAATAGMRAAVALTGVEREEVPRGTTLTDAKEWTPSERFTARIEALPEWGDTPSGRRVRVHLGTQEVMARLYPVGGDIEGAPAVTEVRTESPVVVRGGDRFVVRAYSPVVTIGGGSVLEPHPPRRRLRKGHSEAFAALSGAAHERAGALLDLAGAAGMSLRELAVQAGVALSDLEQWITSGDLRARTLDDRVYARQAEQAVAAALLASLDDAHRSHPMRPGVRVADVRPENPHARALWTHVRTALEDRGEIATMDQWLHRPTHEPRPADEDRALVAEVRSALEAAGLEVPRADDLMERVPDAQGVEDVQRCLEFLVVTGAAVRLPDDRIVAAQILEEATAQVLQQLGGQTGLGPADFRTVLDVSRKHLMPLLAFLDSTGVTVRRGESREVAGA